MGLPAEFIFRSEALQNRKPFAYFALREPGKGDYTVAIWSGIDEKGSDVTRAILVPQEATDPDLFQQIYDAAIEKAYKEDGILLGDPVATDVRIHLSANWTVHFSGPCEYPKELVTKTLREAGMRFS